MANTLNLGNGNWATKEDSLLAYNSENGNFKPLPFDFTRASSATVINKDGLIETVGSGEPRIDFKDDVKGALLLEPTRTNRIPNSEDSSTWALGNITLSSLSGGLNKEYYQITSLGNTGRFDVVKNDWINLNTGTYTASVFAKKGTCDEIILTSRATHTFQDKYSVFNLTNGTVLNSQVTGSIEPYSDGWYKCSITFTNSGGYNDFASFAFGFNFNSSSTDTLFVAAPQSEIGSYATSYIPTSGSPVTRVAETCNNGGNEQVINSTEGVFYAEISALANDGEQGRISLSNKSLNNRVSFAYSPTESKAYIIVKLNSTTIINNLNVEIGNHLDTKKIAISYKSGDTKVYLNGVEILTSSVSFTGGVLNDLSFTSATNSLPLYAKTKDLRIYNTALTNAELQALTT
jgi:hypothetical protein